MDASFDRLHKYSDTQREEICSYHAYYAFPDGETVARVATHLELQYIVNVQMILPTLILNRDGSSRVVLLKIGCVHVVAIYDISGINILYMVSCMLESHIYHLF